MTGDLVSASATAGPALLGRGELCFNAGRLDRSIALASEDYLRPGRPRLARTIAT